MALKVRAIDASLFSFTLSQALLVKSRLYLYRTLLGTGSAQPVSWARIAERINFLPGRVEDEPETYAHLMDRYRYYLLSQRKSGRKPVEQSDVEHAAFEVSDDMLHRWFHGQYDPASLEGKRSFVPQGQVIAAARDMLVVEGILLEEELELDRLPLAVSFAVNRLFEDESDCADARPKLASAYVSYRHVGGELLVEFLHIEQATDAGIVAFWRDSLRYPDIGRQALARMLDEARHNRKPDIRGRSGWLPLGPSPIWLAFLEAIVNHSASVTLAEPISFRKQQIASLQFRGLDSYEWHGGRPTQATSGRARSVFTDIRKENILEYFDEIMDNTKIRRPLGFQKSEQYGGVLQEEDKSRFLYEILSKRADWDNPRGDKGLAARMIREGVDVNAYRSPRGVTVAHLAASCRMQDVLEALMEVEDLDLLVRDRAGRTAADYAFRVDAEWGARLTERMVEQAQRQGVDVTQFIRRGSFVPPEPGMG